MEDLICLLATVRTLKWKIVVVLKVVLQYLWKILLFCFSCQNAQLSYSTLFFVLHVKKQKGKGKNKNKTLKVNLPCQFTKIWYGFLFPDYISKIVELWNENKVCHQAWRSSLPRCRAEIILEYKEDDLFP